MARLVKTKDWKPKYYDPSKDHVILGNHVARFIGATMARMMRGYPSIKDSWSTREASKALSFVKETRTQEAYKDMHCCMHFSDD